MEDRRLWDKLTQGSRQLAVQADSEIWRRCPDRKIRPLVTPGIMVRIGGQRPFPAQKVEPGRRLERAG
jgi:hypothetical protein